jgi:mRNA interferase MazF
VKRGIIVTIVLPGTYGKPRPALVIQSDLFDEHPSITILPVTSHLRDTPLFRLDLDPDSRNGLKKPSQIMVDKVQTVPRDKVGQVVGRVDDALIVEVSRALLVFLGLA